MQGFVGLAVKIVLTFSHTLVPGFAVIESEVAPTVLTTDMVSGLAFKGFVVWQAKGEVTFKLITSALFKVLVV